MMDLRILTLLVVVFGVVYSHTIPQNDEDKFNTLIGMMKKLQEHVTNLENQQQQLKVKMMDSMDNFEGKIQNLQETLTEQYDQIELHLQNEGGTINNNYYGCDNSTTMTPTQPPTTTMPPTEPPTTTMLPSQPPVTKAEDCTELYSNGYISEGVYEVYPDGGEALDVYCQDGWTLLQKRTDDSVDYKKTMEEYERGFGSVRGEHWIGLNAMNKLTEQGSYTVRFELEDFDGDTAWTEYTNFRVGAAPYYTLMYDYNSYNGTAGNSLQYNHENSFSTFDVDQDVWSGVSCTTLIWSDGSSYGGGGWWFSYCGGSSTTGMPYRSKHSIMWYDWKLTTGLKSAIMKIKRV